MQDAAYPGLIARSSIYLINEGDFMSKKSIPLAIASMVAGIACMPVAGLVSTTLGIGLAGLSVYFIYIAG